VDRTVSQRVRDGGFVGLPIRFGGGTLGTQQLEELAQPVLEQSRHTGLRGLLAAAFRVRGGNRRRISRTLRETLVLRAWSFIGRRRFRGSVLRDRVAAR
jgi:hypothetical protein